MSAVYGIDVSEYHGFIHVALSGEIDLSNAAAIRACVAGHLGQPATTGLVIDLAEAVFLDSVGIAMLVGCRQLAKNAAIPFGAINAQGQVRRVLDIAGVREHLNSDAVVPPRGLDGSAPSDILGAPTP